jgi:cell division protein FtsI/penicillin-binding protein 2
MEDKIKFRSRIFLILTLIFSLILCGTLYWLQIHNGKEYAKKAEAQYVDQGSKLLNRGSIYLTSKDDIKVQGATLKSGYTIYINPSILTEPNVAFKAISQYVDISEEDFIKKANRQNDKYEVVANQVSEQVANSVKNLKILGLGVTKEVWRLYPGETMLAHELGILGQTASSSDIVGKYGLERNYEPVLKRNKTSKGYIFAELFGDEKDDSNLKLQNKEGDIVTTIEPTTQKYLERILEQINDRWKPETVGGIIIDPNSGEILAMSSIPTFNPNDIGSVKDLKVLSNPLVENAYEMGSIIKPLTVATALDDGVINPNSTYDDTGTMVVSGKKIANHDSKARGITTIQDLLGYSLNVGAATFALKVGKEQFAKYFFSYGIGSKTGIDLPNEATGLTNNLKTGRDVEIATAAYGQGIAVSPIAVAKALSVLANGGYVIKPHLVKEIRYTDGTSEILKQMKDGPVLQKKTTDEVTKMLVNVVDNTLVHGAIKNEHYSIAAKTGTAQIADREKGGYYKDRYLHSFFGYFPAYNPKYLVFLFQVYPKGTEYAADTLTDPFDQIAKFMINYFNIAPDR